MFIHLQTSTAALKGHHSLCDLHVMYFFNLNLNRTKFLINLSGILQS